MADFDKIKSALEYIDNHLDEPMSFESIARLHHFSPYYFHRMFSVIVGKTISAHIRDRRLEKACAKISSTGKSLTEICMECGFDSAQSFSRCFRNAYGMPPSVYRKDGFTPNTISVDEMIRKFTNRLKGGIIVNPKIIKKEKLLIAGNSGDGSKTAEIWQSFIELDKEKPLPNKKSDNGYEIRTFENYESKVFVGVEVKDKIVPDEYELTELPASTYASFEVYVAKGYDSENNAMDEWLKTNEQGYNQKLLAGNPYVVEFYDERFEGESEDSIVEILIPIEK